MAAAISPSSIFFEDCERYEVEFAMFRKKEGIESRAGTGDAAYEKRYWRFLVDRYPGRLKNWLQFDTAKSTLRALKRRQWWETLKTCLEMECDFLHPGLDNDALMKNLHELMLVIDKTDSAVDQEALRIIFLEAVKFMVPSTELDCSIPWLLQAHSKSKIQILGTSMVGSISYEKRLAQMALSEGARSTDSNASVQQAKTAAKAKAPAHKAKKQGRVANDANATTGTMTLPTKWIEDLAEIISSLALASSGRNKTFDTNAVQKQFAMIGLIFAWTGKLTVNDRVVRVWSQARAEIEKLASGAIAAFGLNSQNAVATQAELTSRLLQVTAEGTDNRPQADGAGDNNTGNTGLASLDSDEFERLRKFLVENQLGMPARHHRACQDIFKSCWESLQGKGSGSDALTMTELVDVIHSCGRQVLSDVWVNYAISLSDQIRMACDMPPAAIELFTDGAKAR